MRKFSLRLTHPSETLFSVAHHNFIGEISTCENCGAFCATNVFPVIDYPHGTRFVEFDSMPAAVIPFDDGDYGCTECEGEKALLRLE